ncbi:MAG: hypothetical protein WC236_01910 [Gallionellaceae bacterium]|jgi:hypothetical protein
MATRAGTLLSAAVASLPGAHYKPLSGNFTAWLCRGTQCLPPIIALDELRDVIRN